MKQKIRQAYIRGMIDMAMFLAANGFIIWYMYVFFEKLFS